MTRTHVEPMRAAISPDSRPRRCHTALLLLSVLTVVVAHAEPDTITVQLKISADDGIKNQVESYFSSALRNIPEVRIVQKDASFEISVIAIDHRTQTGVSTGVVSLALLISRLIPLGFLDIREMGFKGVVAEDRLAIEKFILRGSAHVRDFSLHTGPMTDLELICKAAVADFDVNELKPLREDLGQIETASASDRR